MKKKNNSVRNGIIAIVSFVLLFAIGFIYVQSTYSNKLKSLKVTISSGPVSPEYQQTQTIFISGNSCTLTITKLASKQTSTETCTVQAGKFEQLQKDAQSYGLIDKIISNQKDSGSDLLGGKKFTFEATLNDGTTFTTVADDNFIENIQPFINSLNLYVPQFSKLGL